jgi:hypothetical protein
MQRRLFVQGMVASVASAGATAIGWRGLTAAHAAPAPPDPTNLGQVLAGYRRPEPRIVYSISAQRVWVYDATGTRLRTYPVSGRAGNPSAGWYRVFSKAPQSFSTNNPAVQWNYMVRFAVSPRGNNIGFHQIPVRCGEDGSCRPLQSEAELGSPRSAGCVRQSARDARWLYGWAEIGTLVVVNR